MTQKKNGVKASNHKGLRVIKEKKREEIPAIVTTREKVIERKEQKRWRKIKKDMEKIKLKEIEKLAREERNKYYREYRAANKEKIAKINKRYWANKALKRKEGSND